MFINKYSFAHEITLMESLLINVFNYKELPSGISEDLKSLHVRACEPMKVAVTGLFSSGKSTFLNALIKRDILPTGINPVTSMISYIKYGEKSKFEIRFQDGRSQYYPIDKIGQYTYSHKQEDIHGIDYVNIFYPDELLKHVCFVDTPGLNSPYAADTAITEKVLQEVDGIIWLTLIENAGRKSEKDVLDKIICQYQHKSICIINQKDKLDDEDEIEEVVAYITKSFGQYFDRVEAISALQAVQARCSDKTAKAEEAAENFLLAIEHNLKDLIPTCTSCGNNDLFTENDIILNSKTLSLQYEGFLAELKAISKYDLSKNDCLLKQSNIKSVLSFIEENIKPISDEAKLFAIRNGMKRICSILINQTNLFVILLGNLMAILKGYNQEALSILEKHKDAMGVNMQLAFSKINQIVDVSASNIFQHIVKTTKNRRYEATQKGWFTDDRVIEYQEYFGYEMNVEKIDDKLFTSNLLSGLLEEYFTILSEAKTEISGYLDELFNKLNQDIEFWKTQTIKSCLVNNKIELESKYTDFKIIAYEIFQIVTNTYENIIIKAIGDIANELDSMRNIVGWNYISSITATIYEFKYDMEMRDQWYQFDPEKYPLLKPTLKDITELLEGKIYVELLKTFFIGDQACLHGILSDLGSSLNDAFEEKNGLLSNYQKGYAIQIEQIEKFNTVIDSCNNQKTIVSCPNCKIFIRVPNGKIGNITCRQCKHNFYAET